MLRNLRSLSVSDEFGNVEAAVSLRRSSSAPRMAHRRFACPAP